MTICTSRPSGVRSWWRARQVKIWSGRTRVPARPCPITATTPPSPTRRPRAPHRRSRAQLVRRHSRLTAVAVELVEAGVSLWSCRAALAGRVSCGVLSWSMAFLSFLFPPRLGCRSRVEDSDRRVHRASPGPGVPCRRPVGPPKRDSSPRTALWCIQLWHCPDAGRRSGTSPPEQVGQIHAGVASHRDR